MIISKFISDHAKGSKRNQAIIEQEVEIFFKSNKITEQSLKELKKRVLSVLAGKAPSSAAGDNQSVKSQTKLNQGDQQPGDNQSVRSNQSKRSNASQNQSIRGDQQSETSSRAPLSIYNLDADEDDEWATLVKFDTELHKKEGELEKIRNAEFKKKIKQELDRQLDEKSRRKNEESVEENAYVALQFDQMKAYDQREKQKEDELKDKIMQEKRMRDKQVADENRRKKEEKKRQQGLDQQLLSRIREEKVREEDEYKSKQEREYQRLQIMMKENAEHREKLDYEAKNEKDNDIRLQKEYTRLLIEQENQREQEKRDREDKIKRIMSAFADTVVKDQKALIREEDEKMMRHINAQNETQLEEEIRKKQASKENKLGMREFLGNQMDQKKQREAQENDVNKMQAEIWAQDREQFQTHENEKNSYIKMVNKKHADILQDQMHMKNKANKGKMNTNELKQNQDKFRKIADTGAVSLAKSKPEELSKKRDFAKR